MAQQDALRNFCVRVEIDGLPEAAFSEVIIGECTSDVIEYREGNARNVLRKLPGLCRFGNVVLKRGVTQSLDLFNWHKQITDGQVTRRTVAITVQDEAGADQARFVVVRAWPVKFHVGALIATGNEVFIELLELANEGIERTQ